MDLRGIFLLSSYAFFVFINNEHLHNLIDGFEH